MGTGNNTKVKELNILYYGDTVIGYWNDRIAVRRADGIVEIWSVSADRAMPSKPLVVVGYIPGDPGSMPPVNDGNWGDIEITDF